MWDALLWCYLGSSVLLINHEIDSAYWKEWELFKLPGGINGFLAVHFPILFAILLGAVLVARQTLAGLVLALVLAAGGIFALTIHTVFIKKGHPQFKTAMSLFILWANLAVSLALAAIAVYLLASI